MRSDIAESDTTWLAGALAKPVATLSPDLTCGEVYEMMAGDDSNVARAIVVADRPLGIVDRVSMLSSFSRQYYRELFTHRPVTRLMDPRPVIVEADQPIEAIGLQLVANKPAALNAGFIVVREGRYLGIGCSVELLQLVARRARERAHQLEDAHRRIRAFNEELERRVEERKIALRAAQDELVRKERLSALGQLTATVAHELRNPLSAIRNTLFAMKEKTGSAGLDFDRPLGRIDRSISRCDRIIDDLLDFTRARSLRLSRVAADAWLGELLDEQSVPTEIKLVRRFDAADCVVALDTDLMHQAVINLIENAAQALAEPLGRDRLILVGTRAVSDFYEVTIEDTGIGIAADILPKVFEPLFSTKSFGTGLGLPTVKQILDQHSGVITIASDAGRGTRVTLRLPREAGQEIAA